MKRWDSDPAYRRARRRLIGFDPVTIAVPQPAQSITSSLASSAVPTIRATWCRLARRATTDAEVPWEGGSKRNGDGSVEANAIPAT